MSIFSRFPYTDFHRLNADWILEKIQDAIDAVAESLGLVRQSAADAAAAAEAAEHAADGSVRYDRAQTLSEAEERQAQNNINVVDASVTSMLELSVRDLDAHTVQVDQSQTFTTAQQAQARSNIGAASQTDLNDDVGALQELIDMTTSQVRNCIRYDMAQVLTDAQKTQARANIGAAAEGSAPAPEGAVLYTQAQSLTSQEKTQARSNIDAVSPDDPAFYGSVQISIPAAQQYSADEIQIAPVSLTNASILQLFGTQSSNVRIKGVAAPVNDDEAVNLGTLYGAILKEVTVTGNTPSIDLASEVDGTAYETLITCTGTAPTSITISAAVNSPMLATIVFTTGTAPTFDTPLAINGLDDLIPEANMIYEISIRSNRATWRAWEVVA